MTITASFKKHPKLDRFELKSVFRDGIPLTINWSNDQLNDLKILHDINISEELKELCEENLKLNGIEITEEEREELYSLIEVTERIM